MNSKQRISLENALSSTTSAKVRAHYCCGCEQSECTAVSEEVTTKLIPVLVEITTPSQCIHPCESFILTVRIQNGAACTICSPKLQFTACPGVHFCNSPCINDIPAGESTTVTVSVKTDRNIGCSCCIKAILSFMQEDCCCKAVSNEWVTTVSRTVPGLCIQKSISPTCCVTPGEILCVSLQVQNTGNVTLNDVCITDELPYGTVYLANSTRICGMTAIDKNPTDGITLSALNPKEQINITYRLLVSEISGSKC